MQFGEFVRAFIATAQAGTPASLPCRTFERVRYVQAIFDETK
jgi:hypothetical protein